MVHRKYLITNTFFTLSAFTPLHNTLNNLTGVQAIKSSNIAENTAYSIQQMNLPTFWYRNLVLRSWHRFWYRNQMASTLGFLYKILGGGEGYVIDGVYGTDVFFQYASH